MNFTAICVSIGAIFMLVFGYCLCRISREVDEITDQIIRELDELPKNSK